MTHTLTLILNLTLTTTLDIHQPDPNPNDDQVTIVETAKLDRKQKRVSYYIAFEFQPHFEGGGGSTTLIIGQSRAFFLTLTLNLTLNGATGF